jgi:hypothetical protein
LRSENCVDRTFGKGILIDTFGQSIMVFNKLVGVGGVLATLVTLGSGAATPATYDGECSPSPFSMW